MFKVMILVSSLLVSIFANAHGEDTYGPHKGFVRMPGAFHTEVVRHGKNKLKVYLLDIDWKNPSVVKSNVQVIYNETTEAKCSVKQKYFLCSFPKTVNLTKKGELKVIAEREEQKGAEAFYPLPLKLEVANDAHGDNH